MAKKDIVYQVITDQLISLLEKAIQDGDQAPWRKPWGMDTSKLFMRKFVNGKECRGINIWILLASGKQGPWASWNQIKKAGGRVTEPKKYTRIVFWKFIEKEDAGGKIKRIPLLRYYKVYSIPEQTEGCKFPKWYTRTLESVGDTPPNPYESAQALWAEFVNREKFPFIEGGDRAYYSITLDEIHMPRMAQYMINLGDQDLAWAAYWQTAFHEGVHLTGHKSRLERFTDGEQHLFGSESYSKEELIAEMGSCFLLSHVGIEHRQVQDNSIAYLRSWIGRLKDDPKLAVSAAGKAQKAVDYILGDTK
jgi:antirestriction protein ArdC